MSSPSKGAWTAASSTGLSGRARAGGGSGAEGGEGGGRRAVSWVCCSDEDDGGRSCVSFDLDGSPPVAATICDALTAAAARCATACRIENGGPIRA